MFRSSAAHEQKIPRFPRVCGDVPLMERLWELEAGFSPRVRGCSVQAVATTGNLIVFPACAGMFR